MFLKNLFLLKELKINFKLINLLLDQTCARPNMCPQEDLNLYGLATTNS